MKFRTAISAIIAGFLLTPSAAFALSCAQPDISHDLQTAKLSEKLYYVLVGQITTPKTYRLPQEKHTHQQTQKPLPPGEIQLFQNRSRTVEGYFTGYAMTKERSTDVPLTNFPVSINISCAGHWCGDIPRRDQKLIAFVEVVDDGPPVLSRGPCPSFSYNYNASQEALVRAGL